MPLKKEFYRNKYKDSLFVVKAGGRIIENDEARLSLLSNIKDLMAFGMKVLLIYGGGSIIDSALKDADIKIRKVNGRRITGAREIEVIKRAIAGDLSYRISATMSSVFMNGISLNTIPPCWAEIQFRDRDDMDDYGYDGIIDSIYALEIRKMFETQSFVACPCIGISHKNAVNINADGVAVAMASGLAARKLVLLSDTDGVLINGETASYLTDAQIPDLIEQGHITDGMRVKMESCMEALQMGVKRIHLINGLKQDSLLKEIYDTRGSATMIIRAQDEQQYLSEIKSEQKALS